MASQLLGIKTRFTNDLGSPLVGGQVYTYFAGTSTNQDSYSDAALTVPNTNPVILDDTGSADIFLKGAYRIRVFDKSGRFIEEQDNVTQAASQGDATELNNKIAGVETGLSQANTEINKVKLDTGITATAKLGGVQRSQDAKNSDKVSFLDMGAVGDGVTDDTVAVFSTLSNPDIKEIDGLGKDYLITSAQLFTREDIKVKNANFLIDGLALKQTAIKFKGSQNASVLLTVDATATEIVVASTSGFSVNDFIYISSNKEWSSSPFPTVKCGEIAQIKSISGTTITLKGELCAYYNLADGAKVAKLNLLKNVKFENCKARNLDDTEGLQEAAIGLELCVSSYLDVETKNFDYAHVAITRCAYTFVKDSDLSGCKALAGTDYGVVITDGSYFVRVINSTGSDMRHFVTVGNTVAGEGINRHVRAQDCHVTEMHDAFYDSHVGCMEFEVINCSGSSSLIAASNQDGVSAQNANCKVTGSNFEGVGRHGLAYTNQVNAGVCRKPIVCISDNNEYQGTGTNAASAAVLGMTADSTGRAEVALISSNNDRCSGFGYHTFTNSRNSAINKVSVSAPNTLLPTITRGVEFRATAAATGLINIAGGVLQTASANDVVYYNGTDATNAIKQWAIAGTTLVGNGSTNAIRARFTDNGFDGGVQIINCATGFAISGGSNKKIVSKTELTYSTTWVGGTIADNARVGFSLASEAAYGDLTKATIDIPTQGCDIISRVDAVGFIRVEITNRSGGARTFGAMKIKAMLSKSI